ncbi:hypothetical protein [Amycolatopsis sp. CA-126428]|uniref:hypothetical protein n=1 Tax=Amycolatopsis sp. CA-126428 TaxID=2073158 RepID=UPI0011AFE0D0|nr:hypothetical protein [Amycolatopsis sp. CA-126428]
MVTRFWPTLDAMTRHLRLAGGCAAVVLLGFLTACSGDEPPSRDVIIAKIKSDPQTQGTSDRTAGCLAEWYLKYATAEQVSAFVAGKAGDRPLDQVAADPQAKAAMLDCLKAAADDR